MRPAVAVFLILSAWSSRGGAESGSATEAERTEDRPEVVGGALVEGARWSDAAGVFFGAPEQGPGCTGVLVAPNVVLTAAHCLGGIQQVLVGATSWLQPDGEFIPVIKELAHPSLDIGALVLLRDASVRPRVIASGCVVDRFLQNGADVAIVGYGAIDENATQLSTGLREAFSEVVDFDCSVRSGCQSPGKELGAGGEGIDSCNGDSGGPLYLLTEHYDYLVGTTSRAFFDATVPCSQGGVYVRPDAVIDWIEQQAAVQIPRANCNTPPDPAVATLHATSGKIGSVRIEVNDVDEANAHTYRIVTQPIYGEAATDEEGNVYYQSRDDDFEGMDTLQVEVADDGVPSLGAVVDVEVVVAEDTGCGCRTGNPSAQHALWFLAVAIVAFGRRRRRLV